MTDDAHDLDPDLRDLRGLDPAPAPRPGAGHDAAAQALLERILDTPRSEEPTGGVEPIGHRRPWRRWVAAGCVAAAAAVGLVALSPWSTPEQAFATWTAAPDEVPAESVDELGAQCTSRAAQEALGQEVLIAEDRGRVTFVVAATPYSVQRCLFVDGEAHTTGWNASPDRREHPELAPTEVQTYGTTGGGNGQDAYTTVVGRVGQDVVGVELHPREAAADLDLRADPGGPPAEVPESVTATVDNGYYAAWWPGITQGLELTVHLADGTVQQDVPAFDHGR